MKKQKVYDICIVGSGAGAAPIAYELSKAGKKVIVLEKGKYYHKEDMNKDEIAVSRRDKFIPSLQDEFHEITTYDSEGKSESTTSYDSSWNFFNGSLVGGSSNLMSGYFHRLKPKDFTLLSSYGKIEGANVVDWPISYQELEPYYDKVEKIVGVSGEVVHHSTLEPRSSKKFPYPKTWEHPITRWIDSAAEKLHYEIIPTPRAILPYDALGRSGCSYSNFCGSYGCATDAKSSARAALIDKAVLYGCEVQTDAFVYKLEHNAQGVITHADYYDTQKKSHTIKAKIFVVAAQAIESVRLLRNSSSKLHPNGLGNNSNQLGKNLIFSAGGSGEGTFNYDTLTQKQSDALKIRGAFVNRSSQQWYEYQEDGKTLKGGTIDFLFEHANPVARAMSQVYDGDDLVWGERLLEKVHHKIARSKTLNFEVFNDWLATDKCFVSQSKLKDKWGVNVANIHLYGHPHDIKVGEFLAQKGVDILKALGAEDIEYTISSAPPPNLVAGGCRFGNDKKSSVLDKNCKVHDIDNLYVSDASFMPTGGSVPYTWTIYANSFRVADVILKNFG